MPKEGEQLIELVYVDESYEVPEVADIRNVECLNELNGILSENEWLSPEKKTLYSNSINLKLRQSA